VDVSLRHARVLAAVAAVALVPACKGSAKDLLKGGGCASDETRNDDPPFCYRVPAGMKQKGDPIRRTGHFQIGFEGEPRVKLSFLARDAAAFDSTWKALQANATRSKAADAKEEKLDDGKTLVLTYTTPEAEPRSILSVVRAGKSRTLECEAESPKGAPMGELLAVCKAIHEP
jgi:hypothetical protein